MEINEAINRLTIITLVLFSILWLSITRATHLGKAAFLSGLVLFTVWLHIACEYSLNYPRFIGTTVSLVLLAMMLLSMHVNRRI